MNTNYTWQVIKIKVLLDVNSLQNVVNNVDFVINAERNGIVVQSKEWNVFLPQPEVGTSFIAYESLTNDTVIGWCKQVLGQEFIDGVYSRLSNRLDLILSSQDAIEKPLPF